MRSLPPDRAPSRRRNIFSSALFSDSRSSDSLCTRDCRSRMSFRLGAESGTIIRSRGRIIHTADAPGDVARVCIFLSVHQPSSSSFRPGVSLNRARPERMNHKNSTEQTRAREATPVHPSIFLEPFSLGTWLQDASEFSKSSRRSRNLDR